MRGVRVRARRRGAATLALALAAAAVAALIVASRPPSRKRPAGADAAATTAGAAVVRRRNLVDTDTESGTLSYAGSRTIYDRLSGTVTWLPRVGSVVEPGQMLFRVDDDPVVLLNGTVPAFRALDSSDGAGPDIAQLNRNLVALGDNPDGIVIDDTWQAATTAGVEALQGRLGETETGSLPLGRVVFEPGAQLIASHVGTVGATVADARPQSGAAEPQASFVDLATSTTTRSPTTTTPGTGTTPRTATTPGTGTTPRTATTPGTTTTPGTGTTPTTPTRTTHTPTGTLQALKRLLREQTAALRRALRAAGHGSTPTGTTPHSDAGTPKTGNDASPRKNSKPHTGSGGAGATPILDTSSTRLVVTVQLGASLQSEARRGEKVAVELPDGSTVAGHVTAVSSVAQGSHGSGATVPVTITLDHRRHRTGVDQATVSVRFTRHRARHVLSIPVTALLATAGGRFAVREAGPPRRLIPVTTGMFAAGFVQISGRGVHAGLRVTDSQG